MDLGGEAWDNGAGGSFGRFFPPMMTGLFTPGASSDKSLRMRVTFERKEGGVGSASPDAEGEGGDAASPFGEGFLDPPSRIRRNFRGQVKRGILRNSLSHAIIDLPQAVQPMGSVPIWEQGSGWPSPYPLPQGEKDARAPSAGASTLVCIFFELDHCSLIASFA
jgi:hypothetical protein